MNKNIAKTKEWREVRAFIESGRKEWQGQLELGQ